MNEDALRDLQNAMYPQKSTLMPSISNSDRYDPYNDYNAISVRIKISVGPELSMEARHVLWGLWRALL